MEKIIITPANVRGLGDITEPKTTNDFTGDTIHQSTSIIGGVETPIFSFNNDSISIEASNPYMVSGEDTDLTITLRNGLGEPLTNKTITVTSTDSSSYSGITNSNGIFVLYDIEVSSNTTFTATYNSNITDSVTVYPCLLVDYGTTSKHTDIWANMDIFTRGDDGTSVYYQNTSSSQFQRAFSSQITVNSNDVAIDFELAQCTLCRIQTARYLTGSTTQYEQQNFTNTGKVHIEIKSTGTYIYFNGTLVKSDTTETNLEKINFFVLVAGNTTANFKYKDLRVYYL